MVGQFKIIAEKGADGYVAYPLGIKGVVVGEGYRYIEAVEDDTPVLKRYWPRWDWQSEIPHRCTHMPCRQGI